MVSFVSAKSVSLRFPRRAAAVDGHLVAERFDDLGVGAVGPDDPDGALVRAVGVDDEEFERVARRKRIDKLLRVRRPVRERRTDLADFLHDLALVAAVVVHDRSPLRRRPRGRCR